MAVHASSGSFEPGSVTLTSMEVRAKKTHETNVNSKIDIPTRMVMQDSCGGVFHIRFPAYMRYRTTNNIHVNRL